MHYVRFSASVLTACLVSSMLVGCQSVNTGKPKQSVGEFIDSVNRRYDAAIREYSAANWVYMTYINEDSGLLASKANERFMALNKEVLAEARQYRDHKMTDEERQAYRNLTLGQTVLPPDTAEERA